MEIYIMYALSIAILFSIQYTAQAVKIIREVERKHFSLDRGVPIPLFVFVMFIVAFIAAPIVTYNILFLERWKYIKTISMQAISRFHEVQENNT